jgi:exopolysaccharide biosynthesis polyprenyl glycosylphosphotransferase
LHRAVAVIAAVVISGAVLLACQVLTGGLPEHWRLSVLLMVMLIALAGSPSRTQVKCQRTRREIAVVDAIFLAMITVFGMAVATYWLTHALPSAASTLMVGAATLIAGLVSGLLIPLVQQRLVSPKAMLIYGVNDRAVAIAGRLENEAADVVVVGFIEDRAGGGKNIPLPHPIVGGIDDLARPLPNGTVAEGVIIALPPTAADELDAVRRKLSDLGLAAFVAAPISGPAGRIAAETHIGPIRCYTVGTQSFGTTERRLKRAVDIVVATLALAVFAPVLAICAIMIKLESKGPVIYRQQRFTTANRLFDCYKLRTMYIERPPENGIMLTQRNDSRVTRVGAFLRRTSLDEVPQFINVLQGHMSVVGPRPHPPGVKAGERTYEDVISDFSDRYVVKPGITGWAQVSGLRGNTFNEGLLLRRFEHDIEYIDNWSLSFEVLIILKTVLGGFGGKNAF